MDLHLPKKAVFAFLERNGLKGLFLPGAVKSRDICFSDKRFSLWMIKADKEELCILQAPAGASAAVCFWNGSMRMVWKKW